MPQFVDTATGQIYNVTGLTPNTVNGIGTTGTYVDLTSAQTVGGAKTFSSSIATNGSVSVSGQATTITSGPGVPTATTPNGSIYLRTDGITGARLYVSSGGGTWLPVAGV